MWKIIFVECPPFGGQRGSIGTPKQLPRNARRDFFSNACQKMWADNIVKVKKRQQQNFLCFRALILGSIGNPLQHLEVKSIRGDRFVVWEKIMQVLWLNIPSCIQLLAKSYFSVFRGVEWVHCLFLFPLVFGENVVVTCKIWSFFGNLDNLLQKNVIVFFFGNQISK